MQPDSQKTLVHFIQEQDLSTQHDLHFIATQVLTRTIRYTENKTEGLLHEEIKTGLLNHPTIKKTLIEILSEAKTLKEEHIKQWDQLMKERPDYQENNELYAKLDSSSLSINQQLALSSQLARELHGIFCATIVMDMLSQAPKNDRIGLAAHYNEQVLNIVAGIARPQWRDKLFFTLKYPEVARKTKEMILEKSITVVPEPHQSKLRRLLKEEGAGRVIQESVELITLIPELMSPDNIKKEGLLYSLLVSISENGELAALLSQNLPVLSEAFSEKALEAFLEAALPADSTSHTERFIDFLSLRLKHPNLYHLLKESIVRKIISCMPNDYKSVLEDMLKDKSLVVALQTLEVQIPLLVNNHTISKEVSQKIALVSLAASTLSQQQKLLAFADLNLSRMSVELERALDRFLKPALDALQKANQDKVTDDKGQPTLYVQPYIEQFIASIK